MLGSEYEVPELVGKLHIYVTIACKFSTSVVGVAPEGKAHLRSKPVRSGSFDIPSVISHNFVANDATTSLTVSPLHKSMHEISGPCQITQLEDILLHPFESELELVGIIDILFLKYTIPHVYV